MNHEKSVSRVVRVNVLSDKFLQNIVKSTEQVIIRWSMGRQLVILALGLTLLGLGRFNDQDQEIIIRTNIRFECKDPRNAARRTNNAVPA